MCSFGEESREKEALQTMHIDSSTYINFEAGPEGRVLFYPQLVLACASSQDLSHVYIWESCGAGYP